MGNVNVKIYIDGDELSDFHIEYAAGAKPVHSCIKPAKKALQYFESEDVNKATHNILNDASRLSDQTPKDNNNELKKY